MMWLKCLDAYHSATITPTGDHQLCVRHARVSRIDAGVGVVQVDDGPKPSSYPSVCMAAMSRPTAVGRLSRISHRRLHTWYPSQLEGHLVPPPFIGAPGLSQKLANGKAGIGRRLQD
eukprot:2657925-Pleurochrysis_carterae.AAC.1